MAEIEVSCAGAIQPLLQAVASSFTEKSGHVLKPAFGPVGALVARLQAGGRPDVLILTRSMIDTLVRGGVAGRNGSVNVGSVEAAIAVRSNDRGPDVGSEEDLKTALSSARAIYCPDLSASTAGAHFASVLERLAIMNEVRPKLRIFPNGSKAMAALAASDDTSALGCTQTSEIVQTEGVRAVAPLPSEFALVTHYDAAVTTWSQNAQASWQLIEMLHSLSKTDLARSAGFIPHLDPA